MLTKEQSTALEPLQRMFMRLIFGWGESYSVLLERENVELLETRKNKKCLSFAEKCCEPPIFKSWLPLERSKGHDLCTVPKYAVPKFTLYRYDKSRSTLIIPNLRRPKFRKYGAPITPNFFLTELFWPFIEKFYK